MSKLLVGAFLALFGASIGLAYIGAKPEDKDALGLAPPKKPLQVGTFVFGLACASLWLVPLYFVTAGRPRLRLGDEEIALTRRAHTTTIRFADITKAGTEQAPVGIAFAGHAADSRQFYVQSETAVILIDGPLADAAGEDFKRTWAKIQAL